MNLIIGDDGVPRDLQVVKTVDERLNAPAIEAVTKWRFVPGMLQGKPVAVRATIEAHFGLR